MIIVLAIRFGLDNWQERARERTPESEALHAAPVVNHPQIAVTHVQSRIAPALFRSRSKATPARRSIERCFRTQGRRGTISVRRVKVHEIM